MSDWIESAAKEITRQIEGVCSDEYEHIADIILRHAPPQPVQEEHVPNPDIAIPLLANAASGELDRILDDAEARIAAKSPHPVQEEPTREQLVLWLRNLQMLVIRLSRKLPKDDELRKKAFDYLQREGLAPSPLREVV